MPSPKGSSPPRGRTHISYVSCIGKQEGFPGGSAGKESACNTGDLGCIPGLGRSPGEWNGDPLQYSGLENSMVRGAWQTTVHGVAESDTTERLSTQHITMIIIVRLG